MGVWGYPACTEVIEAVLVDPVEHAFGRVRPPSSKLPRNPRQPRKVDVVGKRQLREPDRTD